MIKNEWIRLSYECLKDKIEIIYINELTKTFKKVIYEKE